MSQTRGVLYIHSSPSALCPHVEWAVAGAFGMRVDLQWTPQPAARSCYRAEHSWTGPVGTAASLASALKGWERVRFEVTEEATTASEGCRYSYTPELGIYHGVIGLHGDIMISENRLRQAMTGAALDGAGLDAALRQLLGAPWDDELEPFRYAGDGTPVRWLHEVG